VAGNVYLGGYSNATNDGRLYWWDSVGGTWMPEPTSIVCSQASSIDLRGGLTYDQVELVGYDSGTTQLNYSYGAHSAAYAAGNISAPGTLWRGRMGSFGWYGMATGTSEPKGHIYRLGNSISDLYTPLAENSFRFMSQISVANYSYGNALAIERISGSLGGIQEREIFSAGYGPFLSPERFEVNNLGSTSTQDLPFDGATLSNFTSLECRRTVSLTTTQALNAVSLISALDGSTQRFEWTTDQGWEDLPLPVNLGPAMAPRVVAGFDGRLHIIYYDWTTDELMIRSSL